nr:unnamed protein product [Callosobruchus analis]
MCKTQSKEEVIIAQSENSGGVTAGGHNGLTGNIVIVKLLLSSVEDRFGSQNEKFVKVTTLPGVLLSLTTMQRMPSEVRHPELTVYDKYLQCFLLEKGVKGPAYKVCFQSSFEEWDVMHLLVIKKPLHSDAEIEFADIQGNADYFDPRKSSRSHPLTDMIVSSAGWLLFQLCHVMCGEADRSVKKTRPQKTTQEKN